MGLKAFSNANTEIHFFSFKKLLVLLSITLKSINFRHVIYVIHSFETMKKCW